MSVPVDLESLPAEITRLGPSAFVVTVPTGGPPHVASVIVSVDGDHLSMRVGRTTRANATRHSAVTLIWAVAREDEYCLIVDGEAQDGPMEHFIVRPTSAVMHRLAAKEAGQGAGS